MIAFLQGRLIERADKMAILLTPGGTGYEVNVPDHTWAALPEIGSEISLYISLVAREDALELYGFATFEEKKVFEVLTSISRVGARTALAILSIFRPGDLRELAAGDNYRLLTKVPGIGVKTGQQIFLDLKYKIGNLSPSQAAAPSLSAPSLYGDTIAALAGLGYTEEECAPLVRQLLKEEPDLDVSGAIRAALKALAKGKS